MLVYERPTSFANQLPSPYFRINDVTIRGLNAQEIDEFSQAIRKIRHNR